MVAATALAAFFLSACGGKDEPVVPPTPAATAPNAPAPPVVEQGKTYSTTTGMKYTVFKVGTGKRPRSFDRVRVHYHGTLQDGTVFDSSVRRGQPSEFPLNGVIPGWTEGVQLMQEGAKYRFVIPHYLAYGLEGKPGSIPPKATLTFDIELIEVLP
ncbi:MAG: FKBP-type peptidyl-prolyl cis-trans isomerase [Verrucomicrobiales bacterium]|nr:FKBP-type peptidyl-prolyl cis-trans isomerase [Verrucomicrobiales bacterium]